MNVVYKFYLRTKMKHLQNINILFVTRDYAFL